MTHFTLGTGEHDTVGYYWRLNLRDQGIRSICQLRRERERQLSVFSLGRDSSKGVTPR
jgi:hypothetical protein